MSPMRCSTMGLIIGFSLVASVRAELILGTSLDITWNRSASPLGSETVTVPFLWNGMNDSELTSFAVAIKITGGSSGTLELGPTIAFPTVNPVFPSFSTSAPVKSDPAPGSGIVALSGENAVFADVAVPSSGKNALTFNFSSPSDDAIGLFNIWAVPDFTNYFTTTNFDGIKFANATSDNLLLGQVTVYADAVPEPNAAFLFAIGAAFVGLALARNQLGRSKKTQLTSTGSGSCQ